MLIKDGETGFMEVQHQMWILSEQVIFELGLRLHLAAMCPCQLYSFCAIRSPVTCGSKCIITLSMPAPLCVQLQIILVFYTI